MMMQLRLRICVTSLNRLFVHLYICHQEECDVVPAEVGMQCTVHVTRALGFILLKHLDYFLIVVVLTSMMKWFPSWACNPMMAYWCEHTEWASHNILIVHNLCTVSLVYSDLYLLASLYNSQSKLHDKWMTFCFTILLHHIVPVCL